MFPDTELIQQVLHRTLVTSNGQINDLQSFSCSVAGPSLRWYLSLLASPTCGIFSIAKRFSIVSLYGERHEETRKKKKKTQNGKRRIAIFELSCKGKLKEIVSVMKPHGKSHLDPCFYASATFGVNTA